MWEEEFILWVCVTRYDISHRSLPYVCVSPLQHNFAEWHGNLRGPERTPYEGGVFHFSISFSSDYPRYLVLWYVLKYFDQSDAHSSNFSIYNIHIILSVCIYLLKWQIPCIHSNWFFKYQLLLHLSGPYLYCINVFFIASNLTTLYLIFNS